MKTLQECDYVTASNLLGCELEAIKAVAEVESRGSGFNEDGSPKILFERHYFHRLTNGRFDKVAPDLSNKIAGGYGLEKYQHARLERATKLDRNSALESASWGKFQIMGANWRHLGYTSLQQFINAMYASETEHIMAFVRFVKANGLADELKRLDWAGFAKGYNGRNYHINQYDKKMAIAYNKYKRNKK